MHASGFQNEGSEFFTLPIADLWQPGLDFWNSTSNLSILQGQIMSKMDNSDFLASQIIRKISSWAFRISFSQLGDLATKGSNMVPSWSTFRLQNQPRCKLEGYKIYIHPNSQSWVSVFIYKSKEWICEWLLICSMKFYTWVNSNLWLPRYGIWNSMLGIYICWWWQWQLYEWLMMMIIADDDDDDDWWWSCLVVMVIIGDDMIVIRYWWQLMDDDH